MAAGAAALTELLDDELLDGLFERGVALRQRLSALFGTCSLPLSVTGMGSLMTIHTVDGPVLDPADLAENDPLLTELLFHELVDRGIYLAARGYIALSAAITDDDCDVFVNALTGAISAIEAARP